MATLSSTHWLVDQAVSRYKKWDIEWFEKMRKKLKSMNIII